MQQETGEFGERVVWGQDIRVCDGIVNPSPKWLRIGIGNSGMYGKFITGIFFSAGDTEDTKGWRHHPAAREVPFPLPLFPSIREVCP